MAELWKLCILQFQLCKVQNVKESPCKMGQKQNNCVVVTCNANTDRKLAMAINHFMF